MIKKAIRTLLENDTQLNDYVNEIFTFYNTSNVRRVNPTVLKTLFPMITITEVDKLFNDPNTEPVNHVFSSTIEVNLDTIIDTDVCNDLQSQKLRQAMDDLEDASSRIFDVLHLYSGTIEGVRISVLLFSEQSESQLIYNLVNNDKDQIVFRKTLTFNLNYIEGV